MSKRSGFYPCPAADAAGSKVVSQAGGLLLTETVRAARLDRHLHIPVHTNAGRRVGSAGRGAAPARHHSSVRRVEVRPGLIPAHRADQADAARLLLPALAFGLPVRSRAAAARGAMQVVVGESRSSSTAPVDVSPAAEQPVSRAITCRCRVEMADAADRAAAYLSPDPPLCGGEWRRV